MLQLRNGTKICLNVEDEETVEQADAMTDAMDTVTHGKFEIGGFADKASRLIKGMKEHRLRFKRLEVPVAPVAFRLEAILGVVLFYLVYVVLCCVVSELFLSILKLYIQLNPVDIVGVPQWGVVSFPHGKV